MNRFIFTIIFALIGLFLGIFAATNYGVKAVIEIVGYSLPYTLTGAAIGLILDLIQKMFSKKSADEAQGSSLKLLPIFCAISIFATGYLIYSGKLSFAKEKKFDITECITCRKTSVANSEDCSVKSYLKYFVVEESKVKFHTVNAEGQPQITEAPAADQKCIFNSSGKFSFVCSYSSPSGASKSISSMEFDGDKIFRSNWSFFIFMNGDYRLINEDKRTCEVKG